MAKVIMHPKKEVRGIHYSSRYTIRTSVCGYTLPQHRKGRNASSVRQTHYLIQDRGALAEAYSSQVTRTSFSSRACTSSGTGAARLHATLLIGWGSLEGRGMALFLGTRGRRWTGDKHFVTQNVIIQICERTHRG